MKIEELIDQLIGAGIFLKVQGEELLVQGAREKLTPVLIDAIKSNKPGLLTYLKGLTQAPVAEIPLAQPQASYPLSSAQLRLWLLSQFEEGSIAYNMPGAFRLLGPLDKDALTRAFTALLQRHESLRTVFDEDEESEVRQYIRPVEDCGFRLEWITMPSDKNTLQNRLIQLTTEPFDLAQGPLLRAFVFPLTEAEAVLGICMHHIISDGWSVDILMKELFLYYSILHRKQPDPLPAMRIQYKDYAVWQQAKLDSPEYNDHRKYWMQQLSGELPVLDLCGDKVRPAVKTFNGGVVSADLSPDLADAIKKTGQQEGASLFMTLLAMTYALLYRYTGQEDIIVGTPVSGRSHTDLHGQVGFYVNTLALRAGFSAKNGFQSLLQRVKQMVLEAFRHEEYPFDALVDTLHINRDPGRNPVFDVMVVVQQEEEQPETTSSGELQVQPFVMPASPYNKFDLVFRFEETRSGITLHLEYNSDIYSEATANRMAQHCIRLCDIVTTEPSLPLNRLDLLSQAETIRLTAQFNESPEIPLADCTVVAAFEQCVTADPGAAAIIHGELCWTYSLLNAKTNQFAAYLAHRYGVRSGQFVGIELNRGELLVLAILGVLKCGAVYVPVDPAYPRERIRNIVSDAGCRLLITTDLVKDFLVVAHDWPDNNPIAQSDPADLLSVIYTSGSTGQPKGVMVVQKGMINLCRWYAQHFDIGKGHRATLYASPAFDASAWEIFPCLLNGGTLYTIPDDIRYDTHALSSFYDNHGIDVSFLPTQMGEQFILAEDNHSLRYLMLGGDRLNTCVPRSYSIVNNYGPTENTILATSYFVRSEHHAIPIGKPISNQHVYVLNEAMQIQPIGVIGEICIDGIGLAKGYLNLPEMTAEKFIAHPFRPGQKLYRTGDMGRWLPDGNLDFVGRRDNQVKIRGYRIETAEIEAALLEYPGCHAAVVVARVNGHGEKELAAYIVHDDLPAASILRQHLAQSLPGYMIPAYFVPLTELPVSPNGKVDPRQLPSPETLGLIQSREYIAPRNETEIRLVEIWSEILGRDTISINDNFFEIGGHSLSATKMVARVGHQFHIKLSIQNVFRHPTVEHLSEQILFVLDQQDRKKEKERLTEIEL
jgi:tyrocidine synthetase III